MELSSAPLKSNARLATIEDLESLRNLGIATPRHNSEIIARFGLLEDKRYLCCLDLELTCWSERRPDQIQEIIDIGIVVLDLQRNCLESDRLSALVRPQLSPTLSQFCTVLTGIEQHDVDSATPLSETWTKMLEKLPAPKDFVWATFGSDADMLESELTHKGLTFRTTDPRAVNAKLIHRALRGSRSGGLATALACEGIAPALPRHRALPDALSLALLVQKLECTPLDAAISNGSTYRERLESARSNRVNELALKTGLTRDKCTELLPLANWDLRRAQQICKIFRQAPPPETGS